MKIEIYDIRKDSIAKDVWLYSRPNLQSANSKEIEGIDAPINDFPTIYLKVTSTIIEREIIASFRDHIMWAQTSRVQDPISFTVSPSVMARNGSFIDLCRGEMKRQKDSGVRQDEYRMLMPLTADTSYMLKVSPRLLAKIYHQFKYLSKINSMFTESADSILQKLIALGVQFDKYSWIDVNPMLKLIDTGTIGDYGVVYSKVPFSLRTHLIRHNILSVKDTIVSLIRGGIDSMILGSTIDVQVAADRNVWESIYSKRSCWLAHYNMWSQILTPIADMFGFSDSLLPCENGICPYDGDARVRYTDADPGVPCPKHAKIKSISMNLQEARDQIQIENRPEFWQEYVK